MFCFGLSSPAQISVMVPATTALMMAVMGLTIVMNGPSKA